MNATIIRDVSPGSGMVGTVSGSTGCQTGPNGVKSVQEAIGMKTLKINWDLTISSLVAILVYLVLPYHNATPLLKNLYGMGLIMLAILFAETGAAMILLSILIKRNSDPEDFSPEPLGVKTRFAIKITFSALLYFAAQYGHITYLAYTVPRSDQNKTWITIGSFLLLLAFIAIFRVMLETVRRFASIIRL
jgi:uncharacterized membrane protein HdeD (DUF308 family)